MSKAIAQYISECDVLYKSGNATEHSYRPALKTLLETLMPHHSATNEPKRIACGAPDYIISYRNFAVSYVEAKDIPVNLDDKTLKEQFDRYRNSLDNLIITNYLTFRWYVKGELVDEIAIAKEVDNKIVPLNDNFQKFTELIHQFTVYHSESIKNSAELSKQMAAKARLLAEIIENSLDKDIENKEDTELNNQYEGFKSILIDTISTKNFSDLYAQTIAYGMFAARINYNETDSFTREKAAKSIPQTNPFLRKMFGFIAGVDLDCRISWVVDALADLFNYVDIEKIYREIGHYADNDPIIHFYETFLNDYDKSLKKQRGVWYTPQPVVRFIVNAVNEILKTDFDIAKGLADNSKVTIGNNEYHKVQILDPATGTGTFLAEIVEQIYKNFKNKGMWENYVNEHLIPRLNGFEILMASYAMAHLKLEMLLQETNAKITNNQRIRIYLTDSLDEENDKNKAQQKKFSILKWLTDEANEAANIKRKNPIMVILGNPPYSGISQNRGKWITDLIEDYKYVDGIHFKEKKHWLQDDYVKFIRYGQEFINKNNEGILAFINNHGFLDNPTFRGMRYSLLKTFDKIYILDLHGNTKKKESSPDGRKDENVFDIQQGVSINIFVKKQNTQKSNSLATVYHADIYGKRSEKYSFLQNNNLQTIKWQRIENKTPFFFFVPKSENNKEEYENGFAVNELFNLNVTGIVTARDSLVIDVDKKALQNKIQKFCDKNISDDEIRRWLFPNKTDKKYFAGDTRGWKLAEARKKIRNNNHEDFIIDINYRPLDIRKIYYSSNMIDWERKNVMQHFFKNGNIGLIVARQAITNNWSHVQVSKTIIDNRIHYSNKGIPILMPLYLYPITENLFFKTHEREANLNNKIVEKISQCLKLQFTEEKEERENTFAPIEILDYIYAVLHSPSYREKYKEFLKIDFPRIPYPENAEKFKKMVSFGEKLRKLHLMENLEIDDTIANFSESGSNTIENSFTEKNNNYIDNRVYINKKQYFNNVPKAAWNFYIGGYQPAQKWLKDRKDQTLNFDDIEHYQKIICVLKKTEEIMKNIDELFSPQLLPPLNFSVENYPL